jgi:hypothetical protein
MVDLCVWFNLRFLKCYIFAISVNKVFDVKFINRCQSDVELFEYGLKFIVGPRMITEVFVNCVYFG